jgi:hypothetical protein
MSFLVRIRPLLILLSIAVMTTGVVRAASAPSTKTEAKSDAAGTEPAEQQKGSAPSEQAGSTEPGGAAPEKKSGSGAATTTKAPEGRPFGSTRPGKYRYRSTSTDDKGEKQTRETQSTIADISKDADSLRQSVTSNFGSGENSGESSQEVEWKADGLYAIGFKSKTPQGEFGCNWEPPRLTIKTPLKEGLEWKTDSTCTTTTTFQGQSRTQKTHLISSAKVTGKQTVEVAGKKLEVFVIEEQSTGTFENAATSSKSESTATYFYSVAHGLMVKTTTKAKSTVGAQTYEGSSETELLNLDPE